MATREPITDSIIRRLTGHPLTAAGEESVFVDAIIGQALAEAAASVCDTTDEGDQIAKALDDLEAQAHDRLAATVFSDPINAYRKAKLFLAPELSNGFDWIQVRRPALESIIKDLKAMRDVAWERGEARRDDTGDAELIEVIDTARRAWAKASDNPTDENEQSAMQMDRIVLNMQATTFAGLADKVRYMGDRDRPDWFASILANVTALARRD